MTATHRISQRNGSRTGGKLPRCYVYVVEDFDGRIKIGMSRSPSQRLSALRTGSPIRVDIHSQTAFPSDQAAREAERAAHSAFRRQRLAREWFAADKWVVTGFVRFLASGETQKARKLARWERWAAWLADVAVKAKGCPEMKSRALDMHFRLRMQMADLGCELNEWDLVVGRPS